MALTKIKLGNMVTGTLPDANIPDDITIDVATAVPASGLTGNTLASGVTASSLTSVGTLTSLTTSGNIGLGVTPDTWHSSYDALHGANFSLSTDATAGASKAVTLAYNQYIDSGNAWTYINADEASYYQQYNGAHYFATAGAGSADGDVTNSTKLTIANDGTATFAGQLKIDTDQRYFTKWESTYGNARDYWWRNDGGLLQLGEGSEGDAQVKYTFDTANSRLGVGTTAPSQAITIKHSEPTILFIHDNAEIGFIGDCANFLTGSSPGSDSFGVRSAGDFRIGTGGNNLRMTIDSSGSTTFTGDVKANGSHSIQKVYRIPHPETSSTFTHTVNVESDLKGTRQGGIVQLIVKCYHTDYWYGLIYWTNDGGGTNNLNSVTEVALSSSGITVDATVGSGSNEIDIEFSGMHNNNHGYINNIIYDVYDL